MNRIIKYLLNTISRVYQKACMRFFVRAARNAINLHACKSVEVAHDAVWLNLKSGYSFFWDYKSENSLITLPSQGTFEPLETSFIARFIKEGAIVVDIGANFGWYTTHAADQVGEFGKVHSFEPIPETFELLKSNIERNGFAERVVVNNAAVGAANERATFHIPIRMGAGSPFASLKKQTWGRYREINVNVRVLDDYLNDAGVEQVEFLKCDVEGAEMLVLQGLSKFLTNGRVKLLMLELVERSLEKFGYSRKAVLELMQSSGYRAFILGVDGHKIFCEKPADMVRQNVFFEYKEE